ncbi:hypothetical protein RPYSC3_48090 [Rhodopseudomonas palustris]|nr:hypothetical protein RPYSC3_48090 [Rhodopseudomonas palustris]
MIHVRAEIASGSPSAAAVAWKLQESDSPSSGFADAKDNTGTVIGETLNVKTAAKDSYARVEGFRLNRKRYLKVVFTPAFTGGTGPAILAHAELIGVPTNGAQYPVRTSTSNT